MLNNRFNFRQAVILSALLAANSQALSQQQSVNAQGTSMAFKDLAVGMAEENLIAKGFACEPSGTDPEVKGCVRFPDQLLVPSIQKQWMEQNGYKCKEDRDIFFSCARSSMGMSDAYWSIAGFKIDQQKKLFALTVKGKMALLYIPVANIISDPGSGPRIALGPVAGSAEETYSTIEKVISLKFGKWKETLSNWTPPIAVQYQPKWWENGSGQAILLASQIEVLPYSDLNENQRLVETIGMCQKWYSGAKLAVDQKPRYIRHGVFLFDLNLYRTYVEDKIGSWCKGKIPDGRFTQPRYQGFTPPV